MLASITTFFTSPALFVLLNIVIGTIVLTSRLSTPKKPQNHQLGHLHSVPPLARAPSLLDRVKSIDFSLYKFIPQNPEHEVYETDQPQLVRAPSLLDRVKSINFLLCKFSPENSTEADCVSARPHEPDYTPTQPEPTQLSRAPSLLERVKSIDLTSFCRSNSVKANPETEHPGSQESNPFSDSVQVKSSKSETKGTQKRVNKQKMKKSASEISRRKEEEEEGEEEVEQRRPATMRVDKTAAFGETGDVDSKADDFINKFKQQLRLQRLDSLLRYKEMLNTK